MLILNHFPTQTIISAEVSVIIGCEVSDMVALGWVVGAVSSAWLAATPGAAVTLALLGLETFPLVSLVQAYRIVPDLTVFERVTLIGALRRMIQFGDVWEGAVRLDLVII